MPDAVIYAVGTAALIAGAARWIIWYRRTPAAQRADSARARLNQNLVSSTALWMQRWLAPLMAVFFLLGAVGSFATGHWAWGLFFIGIVVLEIGLWRFSRWAYRPSR